MTSIEDVATHADLLERCIVVRLPPIPKDGHLPEVNLRAEFQRRRPALLGALLSALAATLNELPHVRPEALLRMADFAHFGVAAERALGWPAGSFLSAYRGNRDEANAIALADSLLPPVIEQLLQKSEGCWQGSASKLLERLNGLAVDADLKNKEWPRKARAARQQAPSPGPQPRSRRGFT